jgi:hypothetical protein
MHHTPQSSDDGPPPIEEGHEPSEIKLRAIIIFAVVFVAVAIVVEVAMVGVMGLFKTQDAEQIKSKPRLLEDETGQFPAPKLQLNTTADMLDFRRSESESITSYGWVDEKDGIAHIPIDRALQLVTERGLPKAPPEAAAAAEKKATSPELEPAADQKKSAPPASTKK